MNYYAIGIGGSGAKCLEALTHVAAAGILPAQNLNMLFVDPDDRNGAVTRALRTVASYINNQRLELGKTNILKTKIKMLHTGVWSPISRYKDAALSKLFIYDRMADTEKHLFDFLYERKEKDTDLAEGFRGHPSIGAAIMSFSMNTLDEEPWVTLISSLREDIKSGGARVFLYGSIFGGTGASGFPTIARLIKNEINDPKVRIGGALLLPYFSFEFDAQNANELQADASEFLTNTKVALEYYQRIESADYYDALYLMGDDPSPVGKGRASKGGMEQANHPHYIELYAALAAHNFYSDDRSAGINIIAREKRDTISWSDLPDDSEGEALKHALGQLTRFAFAYLTVYYPMLMDIKDNSKEYRAPWYVDLFLRNNLNVQDANASDDNSGSTNPTIELDHIKDYCERYLVWLASLHGSARGRSIELINKNLFAVGDVDKGFELLPANQFVLDEFDNLVFPIRNAFDKNKLGRLWKKMSTQKGGDRSSANVGRFINALFNNCA